MKALSPPVQSGRFSRKTSSDIKAFLLFDPVTAYGPNRRWPGAESQEAPARIE